MSRYVKYMILLVLLLLLGCGAYYQRDCYVSGTECGDTNRGERGEPGEPGPAGAPGVSSAGQPGQNGRDGKDGTNGVAGSSCTTQATSEGAWLRCTDGSASFVRNGLDGAAGTRGEAGTSCTVFQMEGGARLECEDGTQAVVLNGTEGQKGDQGDTGAAGEDGAAAPPSPYTIVETVDPCGPQAAFDEVLLRLANGNLIAHFSHGNKQFLTLLVPGNYVTTDGTGCRFTVTSDMEITW